MGKCGTLKASLSKLSFSGDEALLSEIKWMTCGLTG